MHLHGVSFGSQHKIWSKQHNGKVSYKYNGKNLTSERLPNGKVNRLTGRYGKPEGLLPLLRQRAGNSVQTEQFTKDQP